MSLSEKPRVLTIFAVFSFIWFKSNADFPKKSECLQFFLFLDVSHGYSRIIQLFVKFVVKPRLFPGFTVFRGVHGKKPMSHELLEVFLGFHGLSPLFAEFVENRKYSPLCKQML